MMMEKCAHRLTSNDFSDYDFLISATLPFLTEWDIVVSVMMVNKQWRHVAETDEIWATLNLMSWPLEPRGEGYASYRSNFVLMPKPCFKYGSSRTSCYHSSEVPRGRYKQLWSVDFESSAKNSLIAYREKLYVSEVGVGIHCIDFGDSSTKWTYHDACTKDDMLEYAVLHRRVIGTASGSQRIICLHDDGEEDWTWSLPEGSKGLSHFVLRGDTIIFCFSQEAETAFVGLRMCDGKVAWKLTSPGFRNHALIASDGDKVVSIAPTCEEIVVLTFPTSFNVAPTLSRSELMGLEGGNPKSLQMVGNMVYFDIEGGGEGYGGWRVDVSAPNFGPQAVAESIFECDAGCFMAVDRSGGGMVYAQTGHAGGGGAFDVDFNGHDPTTLASTQSIPNADYDVEFTDEDRQRYGPTRENLSIYGRLFGPLVVTPTSVMTVEYSWGDTEPFQVFSLAKAAEMSIQEWLPVEGTEFALEDFDNDLPHFIFHRGNVVIATNDELIMCEGSTELEENMIYLK